MKYLFISILCLIIGISSFNDTVFAGQIHYSRIPQQYWLHRIQMVRSMGLNYLSLCLFWNFHQLQPGTFDFQSDRKNLSRFFQLAKQQNMSILLRPGPYTCAEWDLGGIPFWVLNQTSDLRDNNTYFLERTKIYFTKLKQVLNPYFGSTIKMLQIENQYGSYGTNSQYILDLVKVWDDLSITVQKYHADGSWLIQYGHWPGANIGLDGGVAQTDYEAARKIEPDPKIFVFSSQVYPGWLTHWGQQQFSGKSIANCLQQLQFLLNNNHSFSIYMAHGGTNFQFTNGANSGSQIMPVVTSYDYDAPINEHGNMTDKFVALRMLISKYAKWTIPTPPQPIKIGLIPVIHPQIYSSIQKINSTWVKLEITKQQSNYTGKWGFQNNNLPNGFGIYRFNITKGQQQVKFAFADIAYVFIDDIFYKVFNRSQDGLISYQCKNDNCKVIINVQSVGHINFGGAMNSKKGLFSINLNSDLTTLQMKNIPLHYEDIQSLQSSQTTTQGGLFFQAKFVLQSTEVYDTYLDMSNYGHGFVWINGHNLGRYWNIGPQYHLYCPGVWLKQQVNRIIVLDTSQGSKAAQIKSTTTLLRNDIFE